MTFDGEGGKRDRLVLALTVGLFAVGLAVMALAGLYAFMWKTVVVPVIVAAALLSRRAGRFIDDWAVFLGLVILFDFCRGLVYSLITRFDLPVYMAYAIEWERFLCGGRTLPVVLQEMRTLYLPQPGVVDRFLTVVHGLHFAYFLLFGLALWLVRPQAFRRYAVATVVLMYAGLACYLLVPTVPPWMAAAYYEMLPPIQHVSVDIYNLALPTLQEAFDINPIAAMPSLHAALPALCAVIGWHEFGRRSWPLFAWAALVVLAIVYLGEHYLVDALAGALLAAAVYVVVYRIDFTPLAFPARMPKVHPVLLSLLLIAVAQGVGDLTIRLQGGWQANRAFVEREMVGRTPLAPLLLGRIALEEGRLDDARPLLTEAARVLPDPPHRKEASLLLAQAAYRQGDFAATIDALERDSRADRLGPEALTLLAVAYLNDGRRDQGVALLEDLSGRFPHDPEPLYWLTKYRWAERLVARDDVLQVAARMEAFGDAPSAQVFRRSLLRLVERPAGREAASLHHR